MRNESIKNFTDGPVLFTHAWAKRVNVMFGGPKSPIRRGEYLKPDANYIHLQVSVLAMVCVGAEFTMANRKPFFVKMDMDKYHDARAAEYFHLQKI
jgi:hypothetical protein